MAGGFANLLSAAGSGAASGAALGPWGAAAGALVGLAPSIFKAIAGGKQVKDAKNMVIKDPGYQKNQAVLDNAEFLKNRYANYTMPGMSRQMNRIGTNYATAFNRGTQGASSSADVLDLATNLAYGEGQQQQDIYDQNALGKENALGQSLQANALAGNEAVKENEYQRQLYQQKLLERAGKIQAGNENLYGALDTAGTVAGSYLNPKKYVIQPGYGANASNQGSIFTN